MITAFMELLVRWDPSHASHIQASSGSDSLWGNMGDRERAQDADLGVREI